MSDHSSIEWTDATWNPVTGCTRVSPGCANCYIERTPPFRMEGRRFVRGSTGVRLHPERLEQPLRWRKPRRVFVCSLADLFHEDVPFDYIADIYRVMSAARDHTFQVLTKRPERMREFYGWIWERGAIWPDSQREEKLTLPNVWVGVSIENARHTWRADVLREIPAAVRFISAEPLLGSLFKYTPQRGTMRGDGHAEPLKAHRGLREEVPAARGADGAVEAATATEAAPLHQAAPFDLTGIDWLIVGGESGPGARPMHPDWARELRAACPYWTAFFFKQWGEWAPADVETAGLALYPDGWSSKHVRMGDGEWLRRVGKKAAGRLLDGRTWDEMPTVRA